VGSPLVSNARQVKSRKAKKALLRADPDVDPNKDYFRKPENDVVPYLEPSSKAPSPKKEVKTELPPSRPRTLRTRSTVGKGKTINNNVGISNNKDQPTIP
jgi:hypothetical protein